MRAFSTVCLLGSIAGANAFAPSLNLRTESALSAEVSRSNFLEQVAANVAVASIIGFTSTSPAVAEDVVTLPSGVSYEIVKSGSGPAPSIGELAAIRFKAAVKGGNKIDDIFDTPEPYYTRVGSGGLLKVG